ncbi:putative zinc finger protein [Orchesella cincta]|uniref:Putative zinc finger protein n=1 Tax=Orchesella cincta TaxID=48709 RepID=A0A1D2MIU2_ORCCI|nr:putative zinc finger protein [Orchesella cincta]
MGLYLQIAKVSLPEPDSDSIISDNDDDDYEQVLEEAQPERPFKVEFIKVKIDDDPLRNSTTHDDDDDGELDEERDHSTDSETIDEDNSSSSASEEEDDGVNDDDEYKPSTSDLEKPTKGQKRPRDFTKFLKSADGNEISFHNVTLSKIPSSNEDPDRYRCTDCDTVLPNNRDILRFHIIRSHTTLYACPHCPKRFEKASKVERHVTEVHQKLPNSTQIKTFQCDICEDEFPGIKSLQHHIKRAHSNEKSLCGVCGKEVKKLRIHIKSKHTAPEEMKFECPTCKMKFTYGGQFRQHLKQAHLSEKPYKCKVCGKTFKLPRIPFVAKLPLPQAETTLADDPEE